MIDINTVIVITLLAAFLAILIAIVVFMGYLRKILSIASYMSPNATLFALGNKYVEKEYLMKLLDMTSVNEVISEIKKEGYAIDNEARADLIIDKTTFEMVSNAVELMPEGARQFGEAYLLKYDAAIVKRILRAKHYGIPKNKIYDEVHEGKTITKMIIDHMVEASSVEDAISALDATPFNEVIKVWGERNSLLDVELALDRIVIKNMESTKDNVEEFSREPVEIFYHTLVDIYNLKAVVRAKTAEMDVEPYLIEGGYEIDTWKLKSMSEARTLDEALSSLEGTSYAFLREISDPFTIELELDRYLLRRAMDIGLTYATSAGPMLMYLVSKEYEARNLKAIIKGMSSKIPRDNIRELLVGDVP